MTNSADFENRMTKRRTKRKKKQKRNWIIKILAGVVLLYLLFLVLFSFRSNLSTTIALNGSIQEELLVDGYVFRDQSVMTAPVDGYLDCHVKDGERVKENQTIGWIYTGEYDPEYTQKIQELSDRISRLENGATTGIYTGNNVMAEQKIGLAARNLSDLRTQHDINNLIEQKETLNLLIEKKAMSDENSEADPDTLLVSLKNQLYELESKITGSKTELVATASGVFCSRIDGLEDALTFAAAENVTVSMLEQLDQESLYHSESVLKDEPICKIVNNYGWYFSANIKKEVAEGLQVGQRLRLHFSDLSETTIYGVIRGISPEENGKVAVTIYTNRYVEGIYSTSRVSAEIITVSAEGIKVPAESLHMQNNQTGVYVLRLGIARFVPVTVQYRNGEWAIIHPVTDINLEYQLQIYDEVVVTAKNLEDGKVVR